MTAPPAQWERGAPCKPRGPAKIVGTWPPSAVGCSEERPHPLLPLRCTLPEIIGGIISVLGARARCSLAGGQGGGLVTPGPRGTACAQVSLIVLGPRAAKPSPKSYFFFSHQNFKLIKETNTFNETYARYLEGEDSQCICCGTRRLIKSVK